MKIKNKNNTRVRAIILVIAVLVLLSLAIWYALNRHVFWQTQPNDTSTNTQQTTVNAVDYGPAKESDNISGGSAKDQLASNGTDSKNSTDTSLSATITSAQQQGSTVLVRALVDGATSGTCTLTASKSGEASITRSASIAIQAHYALCQGFNIPASDFPAAGTWSIRISLSTDKGAASSESVALEVQK